MSEAPKSGMRENGGSDLFPGENSSVLRKGSILEALPGLLLDERLQANEPGQQAQACFSSECLSLGDMNHNKRLCCLWCPAPLGHTLCQDWRS